ncbi:MAG: family 43 glycosylhydrolase, partial [Jiangellaceae bacterium]
NLNLFIDIAKSYEIDPDNPLLTARDRPDAPLAKAGHGWLTDTPSGELYLVHLCARPGKAGRCMLGRETAIQKVHWTEDGWLRLSGGDNIPRQEVPAPDLPSCPWPDRPVRDEFNDPELPIAYQSLRVPVQASWLSLAERPGWVRLRGRQSLCSRHYQSLIARRVTSWRGRAATRVDFAPETFQQMAGLVAYYNTRNWAYLRISHDEQLGRCLGVAVCDNGRYDELLGRDIQLPGNGAVELRLTIDAEAGQFYWAPDGGDWQGIGPQWDASKLSDEYVEGWGFTGAMVGICCQDLSGQFQPADFDWFEYETL